MTEGRHLRLGRDQVVHEVYDLTISDNHGGTTHQQVALNLSHYPLSVDPSRNHPRTGRSTRPVFKMRGRGKSMG
jgi:hypothetical protein